MSAAGTARTLAELDAAVEAINARLDEYARALGFPTAAEAQAERERAAAEAAAEAEQERARAYLEAERRRIANDREAHASAVATTAALVTEQPPTADDVLPLLAKIGTHLRTAPTSTFGSSLSRPSAGDAEVEAGVRALHARAWTLAAIGIELGHPADVAAALGRPEVGIRGVVANGLGSGTHRVRDIPEARALLAEHDAAQEERRRQW